MLPWVSRCLQTGFRIQGPVGALPALLPVQLPATAPRGCQQPGPLTQLWLLWPSGQWTDMEALCLSEFWMLSLGVRAPTGVCARFQHLKLWNFRQFPSLVGGASTHTERDQGAAAGSRSPAGAVLRAHVPLTKTHTNLCRMLLVL